MTPWRYALARGIILGVDQDQTIYEPKDAAQWLGLSGAGLRRLAPIYERVYGDLPRDARRGRLWPQHAIYRLDRARMLVQEGRSPSVEAALRYEETGDDADLYPAPRKPADANLAALLEELRGLRQAVERQNALLEEQGQRLAALEAPNTSPEPRESPESAERSPDRGTYLEEPKAVSSRPWWKFWT